MSKLSIRRKISLYFQYSRALKQNKTELAQSGFRIDKVNRIYTVINIPIELFDDTYDLKSSDISRVSQSYLTENIRTISRILNGFGLNELYKIYDTRKVDKYSFLIVLGFALFDTKKVADTIFLRILPITIVSLILLYFSLYI